jgi:hypothetical protein
MNQSVRRRIESKQPPKSPIDSQADGKRSVQQLFALEHPGWLEWRGTNQICCDSESKKSRDEQICGEQGKAGEYNLGGTPFPTCRSKEGRG